MVFNLKNVIITFSIYINDKLRLKVETWKLNECFTKLKQPTICINSSLAFIHTYENSVINGGERPNELLFFSLHSSPKRHQSLCMYVGCI